jgi:putative ABC transport system permease protein
VPRIKFAGSVSNGETSTMFIGNAFDPLRETRVCPRGPGGRTGRLSGPGLGGLHAREVVLGAKLAAGLGVSIGDTVTVLAQTQPGSQDAMDLTVAGIFDSRDVLEGKYLVAVPLGTAQTLLHMPGRVTGYTLSLHDPAALGQTAAELRRVLGDQQPALEVVTWPEMVPFYHDVINLFDTTLGLVVSVVFVLALAGIINTMLMAVYERTREVGTLMACGF